MTAEQYKIITAPLSVRPRLCSMIICANRYITYACYLLFPFLVFCEFVYDRNLCIRTLVTAGVSFAVVSLFRRIVNSPRPYEILDIKPLMIKRTKGKSFPSRHCFSIFVIAVCWLRFVPIVGILLLILGVLLALLRVVLGVHFPRDVVAGALIGILSGIIGMYIV